MEEDMIGGIIIGMAGTIVMGALVVGLRAAYLLIRDSGKY